MSITLKQDYNKSLRLSKPTVIGKTTVKPPRGGLGAISNIPPQIIPPLNTNIQFNILPPFKLSQHPGLAAIDKTKIPEEFNWRFNGGKKRKLISTPGNQMLCGSCWAISAAGIVADNHVVSGNVDWKPDLSTTWCLACYPQLQCQGGNPAKLYQDISQNGIATNSCVDYNWCSSNEACNGNATKHFEGGKINLSSLIPSCGCYNGQIEHYLYFLENPKLVSLGQGGLNEDNFAITIKKHILFNGPVQGGFLVFNNFRPGSFSKVNGGLYLENGVYGKGDTHFDPKQTSAANYAGSHAVAIIGWGTQKDVIIDNNGTKKDIPYWYCRNSWTEKWGDGGYFKMPMYPYNKISQFDKQIVIQTPSGNFQGGGIVMISTTKKPELKKIGEIRNLAGSLIDKNDPKYATESKDRVDDTEDSKNSVIKYILLILAIIAIIIVIFFIYQNFRSRNISRRINEASKADYIFTRKTRSKIK